MSDKFEVVNKGDGAENVPTDRANLVVVALEKAYATAGKEVKFVVLVIVLIVSQR